MANDKYKDIKRIKVVVGENQLNTHVYVDGKELPVLDLNIHIGQENHFVPIIDLKLFGGDVQLEGAYKVTEGSHEAVKKGLNG